MTTWLVTGGCGFIGSHLADALVARGDRVRIIDDLSTGLRGNAPRQAEIIVADVAQQALVREAMAGVDGCFHLAAVASVERANRDWIGTHRTNLTGTIAVFDAARQASPGRPLPVVYASSAAVYGACTDVPLSESAPTRPISAYGADKIGCEMHAGAGWIVHRVPSVGLRFFNVYGSRQDPSSPYSGVIAVFSDRLARRQPIFVHGDGRQSRDFIFIDDVVRFLLAAMERSGSGAQIFNVCTGRGTTIVELAAAMGEVAGVPVEFVHGPPRAGDVRASIGDPHAAEAALGLRATFGLRAGLAHVLAEATIAEG